MKSVLLRSLGLVLCAVVALMLWSQYKKVLFPADVTLYVLDTRDGGRFSEDLQRIFPSMEQRRNGIRIEITTVDIAEVNSTEAQWQQALERASSRSRDEKVFFQISLPTSESTKLLRSKIEEQLSGSMKVEFFLHTIAFVGAHGDSSLMACKRLDDDWAYQNWSFGGIALTVDDNTLPLIEPCLKGLLIDVFGSAA